MDLFRRSDGRTSSIFRCSALGCITLSAALAIIGCASPGPPRAPSLNLPEPVRDLTVTRIGNTVELRFTAPSRSTDKLPLRGGTIVGQFCRQLDHQPCLPIPASKTTIATSGLNQHDLITWTDTLPPNLLQGSPRLLGYRVEFFNPAGRSAGPSAPAFTATGPSPAPVEGFHAEGSRLGVVLTWNSSTQPGDVLLQRIDLAPAPPKEHKTLPSTSAAKPGAAKSSATKPSAALPSTAWLGTRQPTSSTPPPNRTLDTTAVPDTPYRYSALRRVTLQLGGHTIELRSALSAPVRFTLREIYSPPTPTGLTAIGFFAHPPSAPASAASSYAVDLIWQPIDDTGLLAGLTGYNVYREPLNAIGEPAATALPAAPRTRLNATPIPVPSFRDITANPATRYRYSVTALDTKGNESTAATVLLEPQQRASAAAASVITP